MNAPVPVGEAEPAARPERCLDCGTALLGSHCHGCGQKRRVHRTLRSLGADLAHSLLHLEGRIWRTLPLLAWRPGELTRRYVEGERTRFVSPLTMFIFTVFLMFASFSLLGGPVEGTKNSLVIAGETIRVVPQDDLGGSRAKLEEDLAALEAARGGAADEARERRISALRGAIALLDGTAAPTPEPVREAAAPQNKKTVSLGLFGAALGRMADNPPLAAMQIQDRAYKFSWALIPVSALMVWLLLAGRRSYKLYDHVVFATYSIAFATLLIVVLTLSRPVGLDGWIATPLAAYMPVHMYRQLRGAYRLTRWGAAWRTSLLLLFAAATFALYLALLLTFGV